MYTAVIIDDIEKARNSLKRDLEDYCPQINLLGEASSVVSGVKLIKKIKPEVVFLDINLKDGTGFDLLEILDEIDFKVIFTTASDAYAIKAFKFSAVDYLLKPIDSDELEASVEKIEPKSKSKEEPINLLLNQVRKEAAMEKIALHTAEKIKICKLSEIIRCESSINYTTFYFEDKSNLLVTKTLKYFDQLLSDSGFYRTHQSHLINLNHVKEFIKTEGGYILMDDGTAVPISSRKKAEVVQVISGIRE